MVLNLLFVFSEMLHIIISLYLTYFSYVSTGFKMCRTRCVSKNVISLLISRSTGQGFPKKHVIKGLLEGPWCNVLHGLPGIFLFDVKAEKM